MLDDGLLTLAFALTLLLLSDKYSKPIPGLLMHSPLITDASFIFCYFLSNVLYSCLKYTTTFKIKIKMTKPVTKYINFGKEKKH